LSQVVPVSSETLKAPEPSNIQRDADNFLELFEKEKSKTAFPSMLPINFQSFLNTPLISGFGTEKEMNKVEEDYSAIHNDHYQRLNKTGEIFGEPRSKEQERAVKSTETAEQSKAEQIKFTENVINKTFKGELALSPDLYNSLINSKNNIESLRSIDVDDLIAQIKNKIKFLMENGTTNLSIELKPENLGTVLMSISITKGILSINIYADQAAKQALEENIAELERSLKSANLNIDSLNILQDDRGKHNQGETG